MSIRCELLRVLTGLGEKIVEAFSFVLIVNEEEDKCRMVCDIFFLSATKIELAEALNISSNYLSQVERGCKSLSLDKLLELAAVLEIDEKEFLDFSKLPIFV